MEANFSLIKKKNEVRRKDKTISYKTIFQVEMAAKIKTLRQECALCV